MIISLMMDYGKRQAGLPNIITTPRNGDGSYQRGVDPRVVQGPQLETIEQRLNDPLVQAALAATISELSSRNGVIQTTQQPLPEAAEYLPGPEPLS